MCLPIDFVGLSGTQDSQGLRLCRRAERVNGMAVDSSFCMQSRHLHRLVRGEGKVELEMLRETPFDVLLSNADRRRSLHRVAL